MYLDKIHAPYRELNSAENNENIGNIAITGQYYLVISAVKPVSTTLSVVFSLQLANLQGSRLIKMCQNMTE